MDRVAICIATCRRPQGLRRLLEALARLEFRTRPPLLRFIVVDNDPDGDPSQIRALVDEIAPTLPGKVQLVAEPERGISYARNTALAQIAAGEWGAFIDDDEVPDPYWLDYLITMQQKVGADIVTGPVLSRFVEVPPSWAVDGGFFDRERHESGTILHVAYTGNVLFCPETAAHRFDTAFALSGGSDSHFFRRLHRAGFEIAWSDEALVHEWVPPSRVTVGAVMRRSYRVGNGLCRIALDAEPGLAAVGASLVRALTRLVRGSVQLAIFGLVPGHRRVRALDTLASGAGRIAALIGAVPAGYERIQGS